MYGPLVFSPLPLRVSRELLKSSTTFFYYPLSAQCSCNNYTLHINDQQACFWTCCLYTYIKSSKSIWRQKGICASVEMWDIDITLSMRKTNIPETKTHQSSFLPIFHAVSFLLSFSESLFSMKIIYNTLILRNCYFIQYL